MGDCREGEERKVEKTTNLRGPIDHQNPRQPGLHLPIQIVRGHEFVVPGHAQEEAGVHSHRQLAAD